MCFLIEIKAKGIKRTMQGSVSKSFSGTKAKLIAHRSKEDEYVLYSITDSQGDCACRLLSDQADSTKPIWSLDTSSLPDCAKAISHLFQNGATELWIKAFWAGGKTMPKADNKINISRVYFHKAIMDNKIRNFVEYHVT